MAAARPNIAPNQNPVVKHWYEKTKTKKIFADFTDAIESGNVNNFDYDFSKEDLNNKDFNYLEESHPLIVPQLKALFDTRPAAITENTFFLISDIVLKTAVADIRNSIANITNNELKLKINTLAFILQRDANIRDRIANLPIDTPLLDLSKLSIKLPRYEPSKPSKKRVLGAYFQYIKCDNNNKMFEGTPDNYVVLNASNFALSDLKGVRFTCADLMNAIFIGANLTNADFRGCNLTGADFRGAILTGAKFIDYNEKGKQKKTILTDKQQEINFKFACLSDFTLTPITSLPDFKSFFQNKPLDTINKEINKYMTGASFENLNLTKANFEGAYCHGVNFQGTTLKETRFSKHTIFKNTNFRKTIDLKTVKENLNYLVFNECFFEDIDFNSSDLSLTSFKGSIFIGNSIQNAMPALNTDFVALVDANLKNNFTNANITGTIFTNTLIYDAKFINIRPDTKRKTNSIGTENTKFGPKFNYAVIFNAKFNAHLIQSDFNDSKLYNVDITGANLTDSIFYKANVIVIEGVNNANTNLTGVKGVISQKGTFDTGAPVATGDIVQADFRAKYAKDASRADISNRNPDGTLRVEIESNRIQTIIDNVNIHVNGLNNFDDYDNTYENICRISEKSFSTNCYPDINIANSAKDAYNELIDNVLIITDVKIRTALIETYTVGHAALPPAGESLIIFDLISTMARAAAAAHLADAVAAAKAADAVGIGAIADNNIILGFQAVAAAAAAAPGAAANAAAAVNALLVAPPQGLTAENIRKVLVGRLNIEFNFERGDNIIINLKIEYINHAIKAAVQNMDEATITRAAVPANAFVPADMNLINGANKFNFPVAPRGGATIENITANPDERNTIKDTINKCLETFEAKLAEVINIDGKAYANGIVDNITNYNRIITTLKTNTRELKKLPEKYKKDLTILFREYQKTEQQTSTRNLKYEDTTQQREAHNIVFKEAITANKTTMDAIKTAIETAQTELIVLIPLLRDNILKLSIYNAKVSSLVAAAAAGAAPSTFARRINHPANRLLTILQDSGQRITRTGIPHAGIAAVDYIAKLILQADRAISVHSTLKLIESNTDEGKIKMISNYNRLNNLLDNVANHINVDNPIANPIANPIPNIDTLNLQVIVKPKSIYPIIKGQIDNIITEATQYNDIILAGAPDYEGLKFNYYKTVIAAAVNAVDNNDTDADAIIAANTFNIDIGNVGNIGDLVFDAAAAAAVAGAIRPADAPDAAPANPGDLPLYTDNDYRNIAYEYLNRCKAINQKLKLKQSKLELKRLLEQVAPAGAIDAQKLEVEKEKTYLKHINAQISGTDNNIIVEEQRINKIKYRILTVLINNKRDNFADINAACIFIFGGPRGGGGGYIDGAGHNILDNLILINNILLGISCPVALAIQYAGIAYYKLDMIRHIARLHFQDKTILDPSPAPPGIYTLGGGRRNNNSTTNYHNNNHHNNNSTTNNHHHKNKKSKHFKKTNKNYKNTRQNKMHKHKMHKTKLYKKNNKKNNKTKNNKKSKHL